MELLKTHKSVPWVLVYKGHTRFSNGCSESAGQKGRPAVLINVAVKNVKDVIRAVRLHTVCGVVVKNI